MEEILKRFIEFVQNFIINNNIFLSIFIGMFAIVMESIIPMLPLAVFIAINIIAFGSVFGFLISWIATVIGCTISFFICRKLRKLIRKKVKKDNKFLKFINKIDKIKFSSLVLILAMPFTPAFSINIAAGISTMKYKKYLIALLISKIVMVYFWGYIGTTFIESISDIQVLIKLGVLIVILFLVSKLVTKEFEL